MKRRPLHLTFALLLATTFSLSCDGPTAPLTPTQLHERIQSEMQKEGIPSLAAAIVKDDQIVWQHTYGFEDLASKTPPTEDTIYLLASISKTITATAVMQLYERGQLDLDTDINTYLSFDIRNPHFPEVPITARTLLTHTSGLAWPTNEEDPHFNDVYPDDSAPPLSSWLKEYLTPGGSQYLATTWKNTRPGAQVQYSNIGGGLLGYLVESITNQDFGEYCKANIFGPLAMSNTGFKLRDVDQSRLATLYHEGKVMGQYSVSHYPASTAKLPHRPLPFLNRHHERRCVSKHPYARTAHGRGDAAYQGAVGRALFHLAVTRPGLGGASGRILGRHVEPGPEP